MFLHRTETLRERSSINNAVFNCTELSLNSVEIIQVRAGAHSKEPLSPPIQTLISTIIHQEGLILAML